MNEMGDRASAPSSIDPKVLNFFLDLYFMIAVIALDLRAGGTSTQWLRRRLGSVCSSVNYPNQLFFTFF